MSILEDNVTVRMVRENLEDLPEHALPGGYELRMFGPGSVADWEAIHRQADRYTQITPELFRREFGDDDEVPAQRQFYLFDPEGQAIGTATAWFDDEPPGPAWGRVHWVAIIPQYQGRGLAKPLLSAVCGRLRELGHTRTYLVTSTARVPAIRLYTRFGFRPDIQSPEDAEIWRKMESYLIG